MQILGGNSRGQHLDNCVYPGEANAARSGGMCSATCSEDTFQPGPFALSCISNKYFVTAIDDHLCCSVSLRQWQLLESFCGRFEKQRYSTQIKEGEHMGRKMDQLLEELGFHTSLHHASLL